MLNHSLFRGNMSEKQAIEPDDSSKKAPIGLRLTGKALAPCCCNCIKRNREQWFQALVLILTYSAYVSYRIARKPSSVVKNVLNRNCSEVLPGPGDNTSDPSWCHWEPFSGDNAETLLGSLDSSLLIGYAIAMFFSGWLAERLPLRFYLFGGMSLGATCSTLLGLAYFIDMHSVYYFLILQTFNGVFQSTGWPTMVKIVNNWFGKKNRGLVFGVWSTHLFIGSILGKLIPGAFVEWNWGLSFMVPAAIMFFNAFICLLFLPTEPNQVCCSTPEQGKEKVPENIKAISLPKAVRIPGVIEYSFAAFCAKLVSYSFTFWLTRYIKLTTSYSARDSAFLAVFYDVGGIIGSSLSGFVSDRIGSRSVTCGMLQLLTAPMMLMYWNFGNASLATSITFLLLVGILVNGPYTLILTSVSADLGTHEKVRGSSDAMATVAGFINGCGSIGGAVGPFLAGFLTEYNVHNVFWMLMAADLLGLVCLMKLILGDLTTFYRKRFKQNERTPTELKNMNA